MSMNYTKAIKAINTIKSLQAKDAVPTSIRGEKIAEIIAQAFKGECGPFGGKNPYLNGNKVGLWSQNKTEWYTCHNDGSISFGGQKWKSLEDLLNSDRMWFMYMPREEWVKSEVKKILTNDSVKDSLDKTTFEAASLKEAETELKRRGYDLSKTGPVHDFRLHSYVYYDDDGKRIGRYDLGLKKMLFNMSYNDSVKDSPASEIVSEIRRTYPKVQVRQFSSNRRLQSGEEYHLVRLEFKGYPGEGATGFGNDPRTKEKENWENFVRHIYKKHTGQDGRFDAFAENLTIYDWPKKDSTYDELDDDEIDELIAEEYEAIADYDEALKITTNEYARERLEHIRNEEIEHVKELEELKAQRQHSTEDLKKKK